MTAEVVMIPLDEFDKLTNYYKGKLTESALLNKAARLSAEKQLLEKHLPPGEAVTKIKPMAKEVGKLGRRIKHGPVTVRGGQDDEDDDILLNAPMENMLKQMVKAAATPTLVKKESATQSTSVRPEKTHTTPSPSVRREKKKTPSPSKSVKEKLAVGSYIPPTKRKRLLPTQPYEIPADVQEKKRKKKKSEVEKLKAAPGWEDWAKGKKPGRNLLKDYEEEESD